MSIETLKNSLPDYAKDIKLNLSSLAADESLNQQQLWGCFLACAIGTRQPELIAGMEAEAAARMSPEAVTAARSAAVIMAMNNVYYRSVHIMSNKDYHAMSAKLRMNILANHGVDKVDFELWSLAVSAVNGCGMCLDAHEAQLIKHDLSKEQIQTALRIAATVNAAATALDSAAAISMPLAKAA
jgi:lipoyl-dependent peroxiredoxin subunit D